MKLKKHLAIVVLFAGIMALIVLTVVAFIGMLCHYQNGVEGLPWAVATGGLFLAALVLSCKLGELTK